MPVPPPSPGASLWISIIPPHVLQSPQRTTIQHANMYAKGTVEPCATCCHYSSQVLSDNHKTVDISPKRKVPISVIIEEAVFGGMTLERAPALKTRGAILLKAEAVKTSVNV